MLESLKAEVYQANLDLVKFGLVTLTWGNVSAIDRHQGLIVIKPSGVPYSEMTPKDMVVVDLEGQVVDSNLNPSSDTPTHIALYRGFPDIAGVAHSHSEHAIMFAQACRPIPCLGTTHADHFCGDIPVTRFLNESEVAEDYEGHTGTVILEAFESLAPLEMPGVLVAGHGPFSWGTSPDDAVKNMLVLEKVAQMALGTFQLNPDVAILPRYILDKHYRRKHGPDAYYGQKK